MALNDRMDRAYLGDGVYVCNDGYHIRLATTREDGIEHVIYLEPDVFAALVDYERRLFAKVPVASQ